MNQNGPKGSSNAATALAGAVIATGYCLKRGADAAHVVPNTAATIRPVGISTDDADAAEHAAPYVFEPGERVKGCAGAAFALDAELTSDANGRLIAAVIGGTNYVCAIAREAATALGQYVVVEVTQPYLKA